MYNKLFTKILDSSIWLESDTTRIVWLTLLAAMDEDGFAQFASVANLAHRARVPLDACLEAVKCLESPDIDSGDKDNDGRRIERVEGGWMVLNAEKYRLMVTRVVARERTRERVRKFREKRSNNVTSNAPVTVANVQVTPSDTDTDTRSETRSDDDVVVSARPEPLITSPAAYQRLLERHAFIGSRLRVPNGLHAEFRAAVGDDGEARLQGWYLELNDALEASGEAYGDVYRYLRPRFANWATPPASVTPSRHAATALRVTPTAKPDAVAQALETRRRREEMASQGMTDAQIEDVLEQEYQARVRT